jgi:hypothetical protein
VEERGVWGLQMLKKGFEERKTWWELESWSFEYCCSSVGMLRFLH